MLASAHTRFPIWRDTSENIVGVLHVKDLLSTLIGKRGSLASAVLHGAWAFFRTYVLRAGFLDGRHGFMLAVSNAEGTYYRYLKLMRLAEKR